MNGLKRLYDQPCSASPDWGMLLGSSHSPNMGMIRGSGPPILPPAVQANNHGCCSSSSLFFPGFPQLNSRYSMIGAAAADTMGYGLNSSSKNNSSSSSSSNNNSRIHVYGGGTSLVLDGARGELVSASKMMTPKEILEAKAAAASKSHSEAERRRRERINNHLATLRTLLPSSTKTDKASLLAEVIEHLKDLKRRASQIEQGIAVPSDVDELRVEADDADDDDDDDAAETTSGDDDSTEEQQLLLQQQTDKNRKPETKPITCSSGGGEGEGEGGGRRRRKGVVIKASLCCDDRPDLLADLNRTLHALRLKAVKAEISTLGGRTKNVFLMTTTTSNSNSISSSSSSLMDNDRGDAISPSLSRIQEALRAVMERAAAAAAAAASNDLFSHSNKRQRLLPLEASSGSAM